MRRFALTIACAFLLGTWPSAVLSGARVPYLVVIDAGHGGKDPGAKGYHGTLEKDLVLQIAKIVRLRSLALPEVDVVLTRYDDTFIPLLKRTQIANRYSADLYVSIHANAHSDLGVHGVETLISEQLSGSGRQQSFQLARRVQTQLIQGLPVRDRGVKAQRLYLRHARMPSALVEVGFLTNPEEEARLNLLSYQLKLADAILQGILTYLNDSR